LTADSAEDAYTFSRGQGEWAYSKGIINMTYLDFTIDGQAIPTSVGRADAQLTFGNGFLSVTGTATLHTYAAPADPLDPTADAQIASFNIAGRQVTTLP
jgi:hypothetical protein